MRQAQTDRAYHSQLRARHRWGKIFSAICFASAWLGVMILTVLLAAVIFNAWGWVDWQFITSYDSSDPDKAGFFPALWGSFWVILLTAVISIPVGVGAALYLEEFAPDNKLTRLIQVNLANLAGVPSIVYGILGLTLFVRFLGFERSVLSGALTLSLLILPVVIVAAQEALRAVPASIRHASLALGATEWQTVRHQILPASLPGILTGIILAISRAVGETAPLLILGAFTYLNYTPGDIHKPPQIITQPHNVARVPMDEFTTMPIQIYSWADQSKPDFRQHVAAAGILLLLVVLLLMNTTAIIIRHRSQKSARW